MLSTDLKSHGLLQCRFILYPAAVNVVCCRFGLSFGASSVQCPKGSRRCNAIGQCLPPAYTCNQMPDCPDKSDEVNCSEYVSLYRIIPIHLSIYPSVRTSTHSLIHLSVTLFINP